MMAKAIRETRSSRRCGKSLVLLSAAGFVLLASIASAAFVSGTVSATVDARYRVETNPVTVDLCPPGFAIIVR